MRTAAAAAEEHYHRFLIHLTGKIRKKVGVWPHAGIGLPFDFDGARYSSHPVQFGPGTDIDQFGSGSCLKETKRLGGIKSALVWQIHFLRTLLRPFKYRTDRFH